MAHKPWHNPKGTLKADYSHLCQTCPIHAITGGCFNIDDFKPEAPVGVKYFIVTDSPQKPEVFNGLPMQGTPGTVLRECARAAQIDLDRDAYITHAVLCPARTQVGNEIINSEQADIQNCLPHALVKIALYKPKVVFTVGGPIYLAFSGKKKVSIRKDHGQWFDMGIDFVTHYHTFRLWLKCRRKAIEALDQKEPGRKVFYGSMHDPAANEHECRVQIEAAKEELGYSDEWMETPVMPIVHPSFVCRQGRYGQWYESLKFDLEKARMHVEGVTYAQEDLDYAWLEDAMAFSEYVDETIEMYERGEISIIAGDLETNFAKSKNKFLEGKGIDPKAPKIGLSAFDPDIDIVSIQFSRRDYEARALLLQHRMSKCNDKASMRLFRADLKRLLETVPSVWQNGSFDYNVLRCRLGLQNWKFSADTMLMDHWCHAGRGLFYNLDDMGARYCGTGKHKQPAKEWLAEHPDQEFADMPLDLALGYACGDTDVTRRCYFYLRKKMERQKVKGKSLWTWFQGHFFGENQGWQVIVDLEWAGMTCDQDVLDSLFKEYPKRMNEVRQKLNNLPRMKEEWLRADYHVQVEELVKLNAEIEQEHAEIKRKREAGLPVPRGRRRIRKIESFEEYAAKEKNWFNPNSDKQCGRLWSDILKIKFVDKAKTKHLFTDLEYKDETCKACRKKGKGCRCKPKHLAVKPRATDHNRKIILDTIKQHRTMYERGQLKISEEAANRMNDIIAVIEGQSRFKKLSKLYGTYVKGIYPLIPDPAGPDEPWDPKERCNPLYREWCDWPDPWRLHPSFHMNGTDTGRLSSSDPNGQNFPGKGDDKQTNVKLPYKSKWHGQGGLLLQPDYSQIEVRVMVVACGDKNLTAALNAGKDIHKFVTAMVHGITEEQVTPDLRKPMKSVTFGILYGQGVASLAQALHIPVEEAQGYMDTFFERFPLVKDFVEAQQNQVEQKQYVETMLGRIRWLHHVKSDHRGEANKALRDCVNTPIQSCASDLCWQSMGRVWQEIKRLRIEALPFSIIHDSQTFDVKAKYIFDLIELQFYQMVWRTMEMYPWMTVVPKADFSLGTNWGNLIDCEVFFDDADQIDHHRMGLSGPQDDVEAICNELSLGGVEWATNDVDGPHPQTEEAEKGTWYREILIQRPEPICLMTGRNLNAA